jgi:hypothetical protein
MTDVTITFISDSVINILNNTGASLSVDFEISKLLVTGVFDTAVISSIATGASANHTFLEDGIYRVYNPIAAEGNIIIITSDILDELEEDVKEILLSDDIKKELPKGYDFISLALLSIIFIANSPYQNALYVAGSLINYTSIAEAFDRCEHYFDRQNNTPQSINKIWQ